MAQKTQIVSIFGLKYKIKIVDKVRGGGVAAVTYQDKIIEIRDDQSGIKFDECLLHEIIHATFDRIGIGCTKLAPDLEEVICDSIAKIIAENYKLVKR